MRFPHYTQYDAMDCGPTCLRMVAAFHGRHYSLQTLRERSSLTRTGVNLLGISRAAESIGLRSVGVKLSMEQLGREAYLPAIVHWQQQHFVVVLRCWKRRGKWRVRVADPAAGIVTFSEEEFLQGWASTHEGGEPKGIALMLQPTPEFYAAEGERVDRRRFSFLFGYLSPHRQLLVQLVLGLLLGSLLQLIFPFLTQSVVDQGIGNRDIGFIYVVLFAQLALMLGRVAVEFIRGWILLHLGTRINVSLITDFLAKLMRLPMRYFDTKMTGDLLQRINDHHRIESFLTNTTLSILFSLVNLLIFSIVLLYYSMRLFLVFLVGSTIYALWVWLFMRKRAELDQRRFSQMSANQGTLVELVQGMQEIKLSGCEQLKRWEWEHIQARLFHLGVKGLALNQYQQSGSVLVNEVKNIAITIIAATSVVQGEMTFGMMLAVQYIIGQLNAPVERLLNFFNSTQDAKMSLDRLAEVHLREEEENQEVSLLEHVPPAANLRVENLSFRYASSSQHVLQGIDLEIPAGKQTAIVGTSGSGKSTLVKLLLGFYPPSEGQILLGGTPLPAYSMTAWRGACGVVMQDGFIFSDTIARNIAPQEEAIDVERMLEAARMACIDAFVAGLPLGYNTKIGPEGHGLSQGQRQRLLIARAVYRDPRYIFLDEATNSLDANNERAITEHLASFYRGRTVVVVAHRLSTVRHADQIVVLDRGGIAEVGTHEELVARQGAYYTLVRNQLEL